ncbi:MAG: peptide-methionine (S)-S-oxide reductase MsrA [Planctomycetaceae bacterium]|jgi:peptide-methionine (S)-S-oxide reductase|nr:peptide-methionine (S)-S-oxide reductase MsrA [Planctomycetaceae bacterium]
MATATFGAGCFWCVEAVFQKLAGVDQIQPGYINGQTADPTYQQVCTGLTGHAEVILIDFQPDLISYEVLLEVLFHVHDPTTLNRQGADTGTQYRSGIYFHHEEQQRIAEAVKSRLDETDLWPNPIVTEIVPAERFYSAETYHYDYFTKNPGNPYCNAVIGPKLTKLQAKFPHLLRG